MFPSMLSRLGLGLIKGLIIGCGIGAGLQYGLGWTEAAGLLGFLIAMGVAGTTGVFAGRPPWQEGAWIESALKGLVGVGAGAAAYYGLTFIPFEIPWPQLQGTFGVDALPALFAPAIAGVYGSLVELDNTGERGDADKSGKSGAKARVSIDDDEETVDAAPRRRRRKQKTTQA